MTKKIKASFPQSLKRPLSRTYRLRDRAYITDVEALSYKQLLRVSSAVSASSDNEKAASRLFYHSLTPPEMRVAKAIQQEPDAGRRLRKVNVLQHCLREKNKADIVNVDIDAILQDAKKNQHL